MGHCIDCGAEVEEDDKFCPECGATVVRKGKKEENKPEPEPKNEKKKPEGKGSGVRKLVLGLALVFLIMSLTFFVVVVPSATKRSFSVQAPTVTQRMEGKKCTIGGEMTCLDATIHQNSVVFEFQNPLRGDVIITKVWIGGCEPAHMKMLIKPGERGAVVVKDCSLGGLGSYAEATVTAQYYIGSQTGEQKEAYGRIAGIVQANLKTAAATPIAVERVTAENVIAIER